jgi:SHS2 domain-containing protein
MAREADYGIMVWDGKSKGTLNNVLNLLSENKGALVFFSPEESIHTIRNAEDLSALLSKCGERALMIFEEKLALSKRLGRCSAKLSSEE